MKLIKAAGLFLIVATVSQVGFTGEASAVSAGAYQGFPLCDGVSATQCNLTAAQIQSLLVGGSYACGAQGKEQWDEYLIGGTSGALWDYKKGPSSPGDPSQNIGTFTITVGNASNGGGTPSAYDTITYSYTADKAYTYVVNSPFGAVGVGSSYTFYDITGANALSITVNASHC